MLLVEVFGGVDLLGAIQAEVTELLGAFHSLFFFAHRPVLPKP